MLQCQRFYLDAVMRCRKGQEELKGIPVGPDGGGTAPFNVWKIMIKELMNEGSELHCFLFCQREKSTRFLRLWASATLRYTEVYLYSL